jgi:hypothetical protein
MPNPQISAPAFQAGLIQLAEAYKCAEDLGCNRWEFAVAKDSLIALGLSASVLRWLTSMGYVDHALEVTTPRDVVRKFRPSRNLSFLDKTCFVLTEAGVSFIGLFTGESLECFSPGEFCRNKASASLQSEPFPLWNGESRSLSVGRVLIKKFRIPSPNQEAVLAAFQEEGWPRRIDDPLRPQAHQVAKCRLHDTIKCLNRHHLHHLLRFRGDGTGEGVCWEYVGTSVAFLPAKISQKKTALPVLQADASCLP